MKERYDRIVAGSAVALVVVVAIWGSIALHKLARMARMLEPDAVAPARTAESGAGGSLKPKTSPPVMPRNRRVSDPVPPRRVESEPAERPQGPAPSARAAHPSTTPGATSVPSGSGVPLSVTLPKPLYAGLPRTLNSRGFLNPMAGDGWSVLVPEGTRLLSAGKPVTASDTEPEIGELDFITDGDKEAADGSWVQLGTGCQYVQLDLGSAYAIHAVAAWHYHVEPRAYHDVAILLSEDAAFTTFAVVFNNDADNSLGLGEASDREYVETYRGLLQGTAGTRARYVRLYSNGNTADRFNHYIEVEVYGVPAD